MGKIDLDFGAITIDNSTFKGMGYKFDEGLLAQMGQFKESPVQFLQTDIVHNEAIKHLGQKISESSDLIERALRSANKQLKIAPEDIDTARGLLSVYGSDTEIAEARLEKYYEFVGAEKIDSSEYADVSKLMAMYFSTKAPFETGKDKKNEFPDAIALLALEGWADQNDINIIAVSEDKGWKSYAENSDRITVVSLVDKALEKFQPHTKVASIIARIRVDSMFAIDNHVLEEIESAIINSIDEYDIYVEASSYMHFEWDCVSASYVSHELDNDIKGLVEIRVVRIKGKEIVLKVGATVEVEVEASFKFSVKDSIDKDYVGMGENFCTTTEYYHTDILLTLMGDFSQDSDEIVVAGIEVLETIGHADFGEVAPNWQSESEDEDI